MKKDRKTISRESYQRHRKKRLKYFAAYRSKNRETLRKKAREYQRLRSQKYPGAHKKIPKEVRTKRMREWRRRNPDVAQAIRASYRARKARAKGRYTADDIKRLLSSQNSKCVYCPASLKNGYHVDHIKALSVGGTNKPDNIQLTCPSCNCQKQAHSHEDFLRMKNGSD